MRFITKKNGDTVLLNENEIIDSNLYIPYRIKFSNGIIIEAGFISNVSDGYAYKFEEFKSDEIMACPFSVYSTHNEYPSVSLDWHNNELTVRTNFTGTFSIEYVAVGRWK